VAEDKLAFEVNIMVAGNFVLLVKSGVVCYALVI
jgi:hypothetical protein